MNTLELTGPNEEPLVEEQGQVESEGQPEFGTAEYFKSLGAEKVAPTKAEEREKRQHDRIYKNVKDRLESQGHRLPEDVPDYLQQYGAKPIEEEEGALSRYGKMAGREVFATTAGLPADVIELADTAYGWLQGEEDSGLFGKGLSWLAESLHPMTSAGIKEGIDLATGGKYAPKDAAERIGSNALGFISAGGVLGALKKGRILKEASAAVGAASLPEMSDDPKTKVALTFVGDILGRSVGDPKKTLANIVSAPGKLKSLKDSSIKAAERLGIVPSVGESTNLGFIKKLEKHGSPEALKAVSGEMMGKLEEITASKFGETAEAGAALGERVAETAGMELEKGLTERGEAYAAMGERFGDKPIETPVSNKLYSSYQESSSLAPDTKKAIEEASGKIFEAGEAVPTVAKDLSATSRTNLELGKSVQGDINTKAKQAHTVATGKYTILERMADKIPVNQERMSGLMEALNEAVESGVPDYLKGNFNLIQKKAALISDLVQDGKKIPTNSLIKLEQLINKAIKWDAQHDHSLMLKPVKEATQSVIENSLTGPAKLRYHDAKKTWGKYYEDYLNPDAVRKIRFTQKPEEIETLLKKPSYFEQLSKTTGESNANAMRRNVVEQIGSSKNAVKEFEEYRGVFGKDYDKVLNAFEKSAGKEAATAGNLASAIEKIDERLGKTISSQEKSALEKMRQGIVQDMKRASPESAAFISEQMGKLGPEAKLQRELANAYATGDPQKFLSSLSTEKDLQNLKKVLGNTPRGKEMYDSARRMKLSDMINRDIVKDGQLQFGKADTFVDRMIKTDFGRELVGKENISLFKDIQTYSKELNRAAKTFQKGAEATQKNMMVSMILKYGAAATSVMLGHYIYPAAYMGGAAAKRLLSKYLTDPVVKKQVLANMRKTLPQIAGKQMTLDRAYKLTRPMIDYSLVEVDKYHKD